MVVRVKLQLVGALQTISGRDHFTIKLDRKYTVTELIEKLADYPLTDLRTILADPREDKLILVNGKEISVLNGLETFIEDGDEIVLLPVAHGG